MISDPFSDPVPTAFPQTDIYATLQCLTRVYTRLPFKELAYEIQDTEVLHFQLPLSLICLCCAVSQYIVLCHIFLTVLPSFSISSSVMLFSPLVWYPCFVPAFLCYMSKLVTCITSYMFHIPSVAINGFVTKHIARKTISLKVPGT